MKFTVTQEALSSTLSMVSKAVSTKNTIPVLSGVYLNANDNRLIMRATDMELAIEASAECTVHEPGEIVLPARFFGDLIKKIPYGDIDFTMDMKNLTAEVRWGKSRYAIHGFTADQFPAAPDLQSASMLTIQQSSLRDLIRQTVFAAGHDESKPWLMGALLVLGERRLFSTTTDGVRIAHTHIEVDNPGDETFRVIVPGRVLSEAVRFLSSDSETVAVAVTGNQIAFDLGRVRITSRLLEGQYPDVLRLVPQSYPVEITVNRSEFIEALERAVLVAKNGAVKLTIQDLAISITSNTPEVGQVYEEVSAGQITGDPLDIGFNAKYLVDYLKVLDEPEFRLQCSGARNPARLMPLERTNFVYVVLPLITF